MLKNILGGYIEKEKIKAGLLNYKILCENNSYIVLVIQIVTENYLVDIENLADYIAQMVSSLFTNNKEELHWYLLLKKLELKKLLNCLKLKITM